MFFDLFQVFHLVNKQNNYKAKVKLVNQNFYQIIYIDKLKMEFS